MLIEIGGWDAKIRFSAAHVIAGHPKCGRLHGHSYAIHVVLHGDLGDDEMVFDFGVVKKALRKLADELDHKFLVPSSAARSAGGGTLEVVMGRKTYRVPRGDVALVDVEATSAERLAQYFARRLQAAAEFPPSVHDVEVGVDEGPGQGAWVRVRLPPRGPGPRRAA
jgi:6-pyruvoyltetrahydropterin/6-carboxytetrahydropterin synthase